MTILIAGSLWRVKVQKPHTVQLRRPLEGVQVLLGVQCVVTRGTSQEALRRTSEE